MTDQPAMFTLEGCPTGCPSSAPEHRTPPRSMAAPAVVTGDLFSFAPATGETWQVLTLEDLEGSP